MPAACCIKLCRKKRKDGVSLFKFPFKREDHLAKWLKNIGDQNFKPRQLDVICSAHFQQKDFMSIRGERSLLLNYGAVPSIFPSIIENESPQKSAASENSIANPPSTSVVLESSINFPSTSENIPTVTAIDASRMPSAKVVNSLIHSPIKALDSFESVTYSTFNVESNHTIERINKIHRTSARSLLKIDQHSSAISIADLPTVENTVQYPKVKKKKVMHNSTLHLKNQELSPRKKKMQRQIKILKAKVRRKDKRLLSFQDLLKQLRQKDLLGKDGCELIKKNFNGMVGDLFENECKNRNKLRKGCRYTDEIKKFALTLHFYLPKAYNYCRSILHLRHTSSMRNWLSSVNAEPGFLMNIFEEISKFPLQSRNCNLVFDSMAIRKQLIWNKYEEKFMGMCDYGNEIAIEDSETYATEVLVFMLVSLSGKWKWPIGYFFINKILASLQSELIKTALILCQQSGIKVWSVTCDGAHVNYATMNLLGCQLYANDYSKLKCSFKHPSSDHDVYFIPDACHNVKLARNALGEEKIFRSSSGLIEWQHIINLHLVQSNSNLKIANKLSNVHINYKQNIMKVKLAAQTLSCSTAAALEFLNFSGVNGFNECNPTVEFIKAIDEIFDFLNSRNPFAKGFKKPIYINNISYLQEKMEKHIKYLYSLKVYNNLRLCESKRKTFIIGFAAAIKSILQISSYILLDFKYLMTYRFSQDHLELFFAQIRRRNSWNNNPNVMQFTSAMKNLLMKNSISASANSNCVTFEADNEIGFPLRWSKRKVTKWHENIQWETSNDDTIDCNSDSDLLNHTFITQNILYYISGNIVKKLVKLIKCNGCLNNIIKNVSDNNNLASYTILVHLKNNGGLVYASHDVYKIVCSTKKEFLSLLKESDMQILKQGRYNEIVTRLTRQFALNTNIFPFNDTCFEELEVGIEIPHRVQLITAICRQYLTIRMFSHSRKLSKEIISIHRHRLTKLILFQNN